MDAQKIIKMYAYLFARKRFYRLNRFLYQMSLRGLGILNYENDEASGERHFLYARLAGSSRPLVLDVGANIGGYSAAVLHINPDTQLVAFEPHPETFQRLSKNLDGRGATLVNAGCGKTKAEMILYDYSAAVGSEHASLYEGVIQQLHQKEARAITIQIIDLDTFANTNHIDHIDILKIDTEGHELEVLKGAQGLLAEGRIAAIQFEFNEMNVMSRTFLKDFYTVLSKYKLYRMVRDGLIPLPDYSPLWCEVFAFQNIVALLRPPER